jgi:hypothetical protein
MRLSAGQGIAAYAGWFMQENFLALGCIVFRLGDFFGGNLAMSTERRRQQRCIFPC